MMEVKTETPSTFLRASQVDISEVDKRERIGIQGRGHLSSSVFCMSHYLLVFFSGCLNTSPCHWRRLPPTSFVHCTLEMLCISYIFVLWVISLYLWTSALSSKPFVSKRFFVFVLVLGVFVIALEVSLL
uniref:Uncharacterized protein n=1 Tax=Cacopsylla melanoneura TaxID=428564 RepID=A0A8D8ZC47_9HEMI